MPCSRSPTSCCSPSPAVLRSHATPVPLVHATYPSWLRQPKLWRRVVEAACGAGWAEVTATIPGAKPPAAGHVLPAAPPLRTTDPPLPRTARSDEGRSCNPPTHECDAGGHDNNADCNGDCNEANCNANWCDRCKQDCGECNGGTDCKANCDSHCDSGKKDHDQDCDAGSTCNDHNQACDDSCDSGCSCAANHYGAAKHHHHS
eukprot:scaffold119338_cov50-Phaeocystis_antarctica.AAC.1